MMSSIWLRVRIVALVSFAFLQATSVQLFSQDMFHVDSLTSSGVFAYSSNFGANNFKDFKRNGLVYPRDSNNGFVLNSGVWIGGLRLDTLNEYRTLVVKTVEPSAGQSICIPGEYVNGNRYRPDLNNQYRVVRSTDASSENLSSTFHDGDLRFYYQVSDTNFWKQQGLPVGFQFRQKLTGWNGTNLDNCLKVDYFIKYVGEQPLESTFATFVLDLGIGPSDDVYLADTGDYCDIMDLNTDDPFVIGSSRPVQEVEYGKLGIALLKSSGGEKVNGIQFIRYNMFDSVNYHTNNYLFMSTGIIEDTLAVGDKVVLLSIAKGTISPGDTFSFSIGLVATTAGQENPVEFIRSQIGQLRSLTTSIEEQQGDIKSTMMSVVVNEDYLNVSKVFGKDLTSLTAYSTLGRSERVDVRNGVALLDNLTCGTYVLVSKEYNGTFIRMLLSR